jgi:hypothetical protein
LHGNVYSQFIIAPSRRNFADDPRTQSNGYDLASGALGGFGGFLHESFRHHDYLLGRRNCQQFLAEHFALPASNPLYENWNPALRVQDGRGWGIVNSGELPLIPLIGPCRDPEPLPPWPNDPVPLDQLKAACTRRMNGVANRALDMCDIHWIKRKIAGIGVTLVKHELVDKVIVVIEKDLLKRNFRVSGRPPR